MAAKSETAPASSTLDNGVKFIGESVVPGGSLFLEGKFVEGAIHMVAGAAAIALLGPFGRLLVSGNAFSRSTTGQHLHEHAKSAAGM